MENSKIQFLKKNYLLFMAMLAFTLIVHAQTANDNPRERLWQAFLTPPDSIRVGCYYYWVNEQVDPKGVVADLEWMKENGITLAFLATDIRNRTTWDNPWEGQAFGKNKFQSRLWWKNLRTALKTAGRLGIEMGLFNCPGWSQSGGPWVKPEEAMRNWTPNGIEICKTKQGADVTCGPCSNEAEGLEVDKLSKHHVQKHFESFIGEILRRIPPKDRKTLTTVVVDSWERGKQNYTDSIYIKFRQRFGYELDYTNPACQNDLNHLISNLVASEYMGGLTEKAHEYGLRTWCEPYAHSPFPGNSITYGSAADEVGAEFWVNDRKFRKKEVDAALGAARNSGKNRVWAESFTDGAWDKVAQDDWSFEKLKPIADQYFHAGINAIILHVMISQPGDSRQPAVRPWFGTFFDRRSQHAADLKPLVTYLRSCCFMLQIGKPFNGATDCRILNDGTKIRFTEESFFEVTFPDGRQEYWNPAQPQPSATAMPEQLQFSKAIVSGVSWYDQHGETVSAHGANIIRDGGKYYLFGEYKTDSANVFKGFSCYSSDNLTDWHFEGIAFDQQPDGRMGPDRVGERPKVLRCPATGEYVMLMHTDNMQYKDPCTCYATSQAITGPYEFQGPLLYKGEPVRKWDIGSFADDDGHAYLLVHHGIIYRLATDFHSLDSCLINGLKGAGESPAMLKKDGTYYWLSSHTTSWERNDNMYWTSNSLSGPWEYRGEFCPKGSLTWNSQCSFVLPLENGSFMYMGDRWSFPRQRSAATYVWQPLTIADGKLTIPHYYEAWNPLTMQQEMVNSKKLHEKKWQSQVIGDSLSIPYTGRRIALYGTTDNMSGYADITIRDQRGHKVFGGIVDFYSLVPATGIRFLSPMLAKGKYTLELRIASMKPNWTDKRRNQYGSTGHKVEITHVMIE